MCLQVLFLCTKMLSRVAKKATSLASAARVSRTGVRTALFSTSAEDPVLTTYGGLKDQDRIFQNLYGQYDWRLKDAMKRGDWYVCLRFPFTLILD